MKRKGFKYTKGQPIPCPKCSHETSETKELSMSSESAAAAAAQSHSEPGQCVSGGLELSQ